MVKEFCYLLSRVTVKNLVVVHTCHNIVVVYYESIKRELKIRCIQECRCDERIYICILPLLEESARIYETRDLSIEEKAARRKWKNDPMFDNISGARLHEKVFFD